MKDPAQAGYEKHAASFGIDITQPNGRNRTVKGPIPWDDLPAGERARWKMVAQEIINVQQSNVIVAVQNDINKAACAVIPQVVVVESEIFKCPNCTASMMKGENHDCATIQAHNRAMAREGIRR